MYPTSSPAGIASMAHLATRVPMHTTHPAPATAPHTITAIPTF